jgi:hypothetical protein
VEGRDEKGDLVLVLPSADGRGGGGDGVRRLERISPRAVLLVDEGTLGQCFVVALDVTARCENWLIRLTKILASS